MTTHTLIAGAINSVIHGSDTARFKQYIPNQGTVDNVIMLELGRGTMCLQLNHPVRVEFTWDEQCDEDIEVAKTYKVPAGHPMYVWGPALLTITWAPADVKQGVNLGTATEDVTIPAGAVVVSNK